MPYELTNDQVKVLNEILEEFGISRRMNRLLQGDVGSGKTVVAIIAMYANYLSGYQSALMAPTENISNTTFKYS